tara:strand:+ start:308 stop:481 length:174 start_codon:yes stop_codon:yes gene_type:complete
MIYEIYEIDSGRGFYWEICQGGEFVKTIECPEELKNFIRSNRTNLNPLPEESEFSAF